MDKTHEVDGQSETPAPRPDAKRRPYRRPEVVTRPLFERMALGCPNHLIDGSPY